MNGQFNGFQQGPMPYYSPYAPMPYNPITANEQRQQQILQQNPQLAAQFSQSQSPQQAMPIATLKGRPVSGIEEAKAAQIDFDGSVHVFTDIANGKIYIKQMGMNGLSVFNTYALQPPELQQQTAVVRDNELSELRAKISELETRINNMGGSENVQPNANNGNAPKQRKSDADANAGGGK